MKTIVVGDVHCKDRCVMDRIESALNNDSDIQRVVLMGDYIDDWGMSAHECAKSLRRLVQRVSNLRSRGFVVDCLWGNHDFAYVFGFSCSGHHYGLEDVLREPYSELKCKMAVNIGKFVATHAGLTRLWVDYAFGEAALSLTSGELVGVINDLAMRPSERSAETLYACGPVRGEVHGVPGPLWADMRELLIDPVGDFDQIVGHTPVPSVRVSRANNGSSVWFTDTFSTYASGESIGDGSMLMVDEFTNDTKVI